MTSPAAGDPVLPPETSLSDDLGNPLPPAAPPGVRSDGTRPPSLRNNSLARLVSDVAALALALVASTITARLLGPSGKGYYSTLVLLGGIFVVLFSAGLGEAAIILAGRGQTTITTATSATMLATVGLSVVGGATFVLVASAVLGADTGNHRAAVLFGGLLTAINVHYNTMVGFLLCKERVVAVAGLAILAAAGSTAALPILIAAVDLGVAGAVLASVVGSGVAVVATVVLVRRSNLPIRPRWVRGYLRAALRYGCSLQVSNLLVMMTARLDLVLLFRFADAFDAGGYSVALTIGTIVATVPTALSYASFPRVAVLDDEAAETLTAQLFRVGVVAAVVLGGVVAVLAPSAIPLVFGSEFRGAVVPTLLLVPGGVLFSGQWILCRAAAARGNTRPLLVSFVVSCATMVALDLVMIPAWRSNGAALASLVASGVGLGVSFLYYRRSGGQLRALVPRSADLTAFAGAVRRLPLAATS